MPTVLYRSTWCEQTIKKVRREWQSRCPLRQDRSTKRQDLAKPLATPRRLSGELNLEARVVGYRGAF